MTRRPASWQAEKARTAKGLRSLPRCEYTEGCKGKAMGILSRPLGNGDVDWVLACVKCAAKARSVRNQADAQRSGT